MNIKRERYLSKIRKYYESNLIKVLTGIRRCGKSVLLEQIETEIIESKKAKEDHIIKINFEDVNFSNINTYLKLNTHILKRIIDSEKYYIFLDEIQHVRQFERTLSSLKATENISIFVTGSNSKLLSGRLASLLVGRCKEFKIMPFSYSEFLDYIKINSLNIEKPFQNFIRYGGMPQRMDYSEENDIREYLDSLYDGIVKMDICNPKSKMDKESFDTISKYIISNSAKEFSVLNVVKSYNDYNDTDLFRMTVYSYLDKMEQACLINRVKRYDVASKRTLKSIEKQYAIDTGFILSCSSSNKVSLSHVLENVVYNELIYRGYNVLIGKTYKGEIDFVVFKDGKKCFVQVAYLLIDESVIDREFGAFSSIKDQSPKYVFSLDEYDMSQDGITHMNIEEWLTSDKELNLS